MANKELGRRLFDAIVAGDSGAMKSVCAVDFAGRQNGGPAMDCDGLITFARAAAGVVEDFRYTNIVAADTATGFVEEHDVCGVLPDGSALEMRVCVVATVDGNEIKELREYADSFQARGLFKALQNG